MRAPCGAASDTDIGIGVAVDAPGPATGTAPAKATPLYAFIPREPGIGDTLRETGDC